MTYTSDLVIAILENKEFIEAYVSRVTQELFTTYYEYPDDPAFWNAEGNTLQDRSPHNTRIPKKDKLKENLIVMLADVETAVASLEPADQISVLYHFQLAPENQSETKSLALLAIDKIVAKLNGTLIYQ